MTVRINGPLAEVDFAAPFDLEQYGLFLRAKVLPESQLQYDWESDTYHLSTPARFAPLLGAGNTRQDALGLPLAPHLMDYQRFIVEQALAAKRFACWADTGLGKTAVELEYGRQVQHLTDGKVLIVTPLQVIPQMIEMAHGWYGHDDLDLYFDRLESRQALLDWCAAPNYGRLGITNPEKFIDGVVQELRLLAGLIVDESSLLKTGGGVIKWNLIKSARGIEYKLSATATPAPNDRMEYASQASFLEKLRTEGEVIWTFFQKTKTGDWIVKPRARDAFYRFMASWSIYLRDPVRFGFADILSTLPEPEIHEYKLPITNIQRELMYGFVGQKGGLFSDDRLGVKERSKLSQLAKGFHYETRKGRRLVARVESHKPAFVADIIRDDVTDGRQVLVWTVFDEESVILSQELAGAPFGVAVLDGSMTLEARAEILERFRSGHIQVVISKASLIGYGLNLQFCRSMVFSGFDDCYDETTELLTKRGWLRFGDVEEDDEVASVNPDSLALEWQHPEHRVWKRYVGPMVRFFGEQSLDLLVTPNHKLFVKRCETRYGGDVGRWHLKYAAEIISRYGRQEFRMLSAPKAWTGARPEFVDIPVPAHMRTAGDRVRLIRSIRTADFVRLAGWYVSEGYCRPDDSRERGRIVICQTDKNPENRAEIIALLERIGLKVNSRTKDLTGYSTNLAAYLIDQFGNSSGTKRLPRWVKELDADLLALLRDTMLKGDGCRHRGRVNGYRSISRQLCDDFQEICLKTGIRASVKDLSGVPSSQDKFKGGYFGAVTTAWVQQEPSVHRRPEIIEYDGMIGCVAVPNHVVIVRRNGVPVVCGNSFERMYQAIRRCYRFGQTETVRVHIPYVPELEGMVYSNVKRKQAQFEEDAAAAEFAYREAFRFLLPGEAIVA